MQCTTVPVISGWSILNSPIFYTVAFYLSNFPFLEFKVTFQPSSSFLSKLDIKVDTKSMVFASFTDELPNIISCLLLSTVKNLSTTLKL